MNRSRTIIASAARRLNRSIASSTCKVLDPARSHPAATASSGLRSRIHKMHAPPLIRTNSAARKQIRGGEVIATTMSNFCSRTSRARHITMKVAKSKARCHLACFPKPEQGNRMTVTPRHISHRGNFTVGSS